MQKVVNRFNKMSVSVKVFLKVLKYFNNVLWQASKPLTIVLLILSLCSGLTLVAELWSITTLINQLIENDPVNQGFWAVMSALLPWVLIFIGAMFIKHVVQSMQPYISKQLQEKASSILKDDAFRKALSLDLHSFETEEYYNQLEKTKRAINNQLTMALESIGFMIAALVELSVIIVAISQSGILYSTLLVIGSIPLMMFNFKISKEFVRINYGQSPLKRQIRYWVDLSTSRESAAELRLFGLGTYFSETWETLSDRSIGELYAARKKFSILRVKGEIILMSLLGITIFGAVNAGVNGTITIGALVALLYMLNRFEQAISQVSSYGEMLSNFYFSFQYVPQFLQSGKEEDMSGLQAPQTIKKGIVFENVSFSYPGSSKLSLKHINLHIRPGEKVAVVGENGAGKSTLALLLLGLFQPTEGRILIDGLDLRDINPTSWREKATAIFQNFVKFQLSAEENIAFGNLLNRDDKMSLKKSAHLSGIHDVLNKLPHGYQTLLGKAYESSKDLSGGEWQKVAIARAYFREAEILVLDEPTASLDAQSEYDVYKQFSNVSKGKTAMLISHRLGSVKLADKIYYLQLGELVEEGSHEELMLEQGQYSSMYQMQAEWYQ